MAVINQLTWRIKNRTINSDIKIKNKLKNISKLIKDLKKLNNMAKKTHIKVRLVPEEKPDSPFLLCPKTCWQWKSKVKLKAKNIIWDPGSMKCL